MGLVVGMYGKPYIEDHHVLSAFWATMEFLADTVVFFLSGIFVYSGFRSVRSRIIHLGASWRCTPPLLPGEHWWI